MSAQKSWPWDDQRRLQDALVEQGETAEEMAELMLLVQSLAKWEAPVPSRFERQHLLSHLMTALPTISPVRQALQARRSSIWGRLNFFLVVARAQVSILRPSFWLLSALVTLLGISIVFGNPGSSHAILQLLGPLLAYLGALSIFRGIGLKMLEFELSCPSSPQQLLLARLLIVLGYDVILGVSFSALLWSRGGGNFLLLVLNWLMPLLMVTGLTLVLSLKMSVGKAAALAYICWLLGILIFLISSHDMGVISPLVAPLIEVVIGLLGLALIALTFDRLDTGLPRQFSL